MFNQGQLDIDNERLLRLGIFLALILIAVSIISFYLSKGTRVYDSEPFAQETIINPFDSASIRAKSAIVFDILQDKVLFSKNSEEILPLASLTKILTAVTAIELLPKGTVVTLENEFLAEEGDSGLYRDEKWELNDLIDFSLIASSNDGVAAIAGAAGAFRHKTLASMTNREEFILAMNSKAEEIGISQARFYNESGLDISKTVSGGYGSARDVANLFSYTLKKHPEVLYATKYSSLSIVSLNKIEHNATNTNTTIDTIPGILASKTGYTELAGGNLAIVFDPGLGRPIAIVVLGSTYDGRFQDVTTLVEKTLEYISQNN